MPIGKKPKKRMRGGYRPTLYENFRQGDLLFGLSGKIRYKSIKLERLGFSNVEARDLNVPMIERFVKNELDKRYRRRLSFVHQRHLQLLEEHRDYILRSGGKDPWDAKDKTERQINVAIRRACKLLITTSKKEKRKIHIETDGMNMKRICEKLIAGGKDNSVSGGEMRAAFRAGDDADVIYYYRAREVAPPASSLRFAGHFARYQLSVQAKHEGGLAAAVELKKGNVMLSVAAIT